MEEGLSTRLKLIRVTYIDPDITNSSTNEKLEPIQK
ncbi:hypothetical protein ACJIZ3_019725 [Penstemon smallii]|uniref:Uncharacterized protein n=1 Tax=Penstemon smallii TaxID=265156 RepID=A0ABD3T370_9LAMI